MEHQLRVRTVLCLEHFPKSHVQNWLHQDDLGDFNTRRLGTRKPFFKALKIILMFPQG